MEENRVRQYSPQTLAYIGDAVCDLVIRTMAVKQGDAQTQKLHQEVSACVNAKAQAQMAGALLPDLTEDEAAVYRRGRNTNPSTKAKNATMKEYLEATGFEAVIGYLYLSEQYDRMNTLIQKGLGVLHEGKRRDH